MKLTRLLAAAAAMATLSAPALAQNWGGLYAGAHAGYAFGDTDWEYPALGTTADHDIDGVAGGLHAGYNMQTGSLVFGVEVDAQINAADGSTSCPNPAFSCESELGFGGSARLRAGFASGDFLFYVAGGGVLTETTIQTVQGGTEFSDNETELGWTAGAGLAYQWSPHVSTRLEYRYTDLGTSSYTVDNNLDVDADIEYHAVFVGVSWHF